MKLEVTSLAALSLLGLAAALPRGIGKDIPFFRPLRFMLQHLVTTLTATSQERLPRDSTSATRVYRNAASLPSTSTPRSTNPRLSSTSTRTETR